MAPDDDKDLKVQEVGAEGTEVLDVDAAMAEAQEKVTAAIAEIEADIIKVETDGDLRHMPRNEIQNFIKRLTEVKQKLEAISRGYADTLSGLESEMTAVNSLALDLGIEADLSGHTIKMEAVSAQQGVVQSTHERVSTALRNSQESLERIKHDYAILHEFAGAIGSAHENFDKGRTPLVKCVVNFEGFPFDNWLNDRMKDPESFVKELKEAEKLGHIGSFGRPSQRMDELVQKFNGERKALQVKYDKLEDGFQESAEIGELRAKLARVPDDTQFVPLKKAAEAKIQAKLSEEKAKYVEGKKGSIDAEMEALETKFNADINIFAKENLAYFYVISMLNEGHVKIDDLCRYVAENIDKGDVIFPYFLLPEAVVKQVVENLTDEEIKKMVEDGNPLVFTEQFAQKAESFGLGELVPKGVNASSLENERQKVARYLKQRGDISSEMQDIEEKSKVLKAEVAEETVKMENALENNYDMRQFEGQTWTSSDNNRVQAGIDVYNAGILDLDARIAELEGVINSYGEVSTKYIGSSDRAGGLTSQFSEALRLKGYATSSAERILDGDGRYRGDVLNDRVIVSNKYFLQSFPEFADVNANKFSEMLREFDNLGRRLSSKLSGLKDLRRGFEAKVKEYENLKKFNGLKVEVAPVLAELAEPLQNLPREVTEFENKSHLLGHLLERMKDLKNGRGNKNWLGKAKISVFTAVKRENNSIYLIERIELAEKELQLKIDDLANELLSQQAMFKIKYDDFEKKEEILQAAQNSYSGFDRSFADDLRTRTPALYNLRFRIKHVVLDSKISNGISS